MPPLKTPPTLAQLSMRVVTKTACDACRVLGTLSGDEAIRTAVQVRDYVVEVPAHLADEFVRSVIMTLDTQQLTRHHVAPLLHPRCSRLDLNEPSLTACKPHVKFAILQNLSLMPRLRNLDVKFCCWTGRDDHEVAGAVAVRRVGEHLPRLHNLVSLDVSWICTAKMLRAIVDNCPNLQRLVAQDSRLESGDARLIAALPALRWLNVDSHNKPVTPQDIVHLLQRLPDLAYLEYPDVEGVVATLKQISINSLNEGKEETKLLTYGIRDFSSSLYRATHALLIDLNNLFPNLETLRLYKPSGELSALVHFKRLKVLSVIECEPEMLTTFLREAGGCLKELTLHSVSPVSDLFTTSCANGVAKLRCVRLSGCHDVDLLALHELCPHLEELKLSQCVGSDLSYTTSINTKAFTNLRTVKVSGTFQATHLNVLLCSCREVKRVTVGEHATEDRIRHLLSDALWFDILSANPMAHLEKLHLVSDRVTRRTLDELLARLPSLGILYLTGQAWSQELAGNAIDELKEILRPYEIRLRIQGSGLYYFSYPEDS